MCLRLYAQIILEFRVIYNGNNILTSDFKKQWCEKWLFLLRTTHLLSSRLFHRAGEASTAVASTRKCCPRRSGTDALLPQSDVLNSAYQADHVLITRSTRTPESLAYFKVLPVLPLEKNYHVNQKNLLQFSYYVSAAFLSGWSIGQWSDVTPVHSMGRTLDHQTHDYNL